MGVTALMRDNHAESSVEVFMHPVPVPADEPDYSSMTKIGRIEIEIDHKGRLAIVVYDFEFSDPPTCRLAHIRAMAWARDLLDAQIRVSKVSPPDVVSCVG